MEDPNIQVEIEIDNLTVGENLDGAAIGNVAIDVEGESDLNITVSDPRFVVVNGVLKLIPGESLDFETEPNVTITVTASDRDGEVASSDFEIAVQDLQEAAVISGDDVGEVTEDNEVNTVSGNLDHIDQDASDGNDVWVAANDVQGTYGTFSMGTDGQWVYTLDNSLESVQALEDGQQAVDTFMVATTDGTQTQVSVTATGTDDTLSGDIDLERRIRDEREPERSNSTDADTDEASDPDAEPDVATKETGEKDRDNTNNADADAETDADTDPDPRTEPTPSANDPATFGVASIVEGTQSDLRLLTDEDLALGYTCQVGGSQQEITDGIYTFDASAIDAPQGGYETWDFSYEVLDSAGEIVELRLYTVSIRDTALADAGETLPDGAMQLSTELAYSMHGGNGDDQLLGGYNDDLLWSAPL